MAYRQSISQLYNDLSFALKTAHSSAERRQKSISAINAFSRNISMDCRNEAAQQSIVWRSQSVGPVSSAPPQSQPVKPGDFEAAFSNFRATVEHTMQDAAQGSDDKAARVQRALFELGAHLRPMLGDSLQQVVKSAPSTDFVTKAATGLSGRVDGPKRRSDWFPDF